MALTDRDIRYRVGTGRWLRIHDDVFAIAGAPRTWHQALLAALLAAGPDAAVSHRSAAILWGLGGFKGSLIELTVPYRRSPEPDGVIVHRSRDLADAWVTTLDGIRVTTPVRTLIDLGQVVAPHTVERLFHDAHGKKLVTIEGAFAALRAHSRKGRTGVGPYRAIVESLAPFDPSGWLEERLGRLLRELDGLTFVPELDIIHEGVWIARPDFTEPHLRLLVEGNGFEKHGTFEGFTSDTKRRNRLELAGYALVEFTRNQVVHEPAYVKRTVLRAAELRRSSVL